MEMNLYKYIDFESPHWDFPLRENKLHFSSVDELRTVNDQEEFNHQWNHSPYFFTRYGCHFSESYNRLFSNSRILCMGKNLNQTCWNTFIHSGAGVCYDFSYEEDQKERDINCGNIVYDSSKKLNVPSYILSEVDGSNIRDLLGKREELNRNELIKIHAWINDNRELPKYLSSTSCTSLP